MYRFHLFRQNYNFNQKFWRRYTTIKIIPPSPKAKRESPTPIACFGGLWNTSEIYELNGISTQLSLLGYTVGLIDIRIPPPTSFTNSPSSIPLDDIIDNMRTTITKQLGHSPVAITQFHTSILLQKYLESHPLSGLIMISPLSPYCSPILQRWLQNILHKTIQLPDKISTNIPTKGNNERLSGPPVNLDIQDIYNLLITMNPYSSTTNSKMINPLLYTQAQLLQYFAAEPVMLEPQPVPMMVANFINSNDTSIFLTSKDMDNTYDYHELDSDNILQINDDKTTLEIKNGDIQQYIHQDILQHSLGLTYPASSINPLLQSTLWKSIERWIDRRY